MSRELWILEVVLNPGSNPTYEVFDSKQEALDKRDRCNDRFSFWYSYSTALFKAKEKDV